MGYWTSGWRIRIRTSVGFRCYEITQWGFHAGRRRRNVEQWRVFKFVICDPAHILLEKSCWLCSFQWRNKIHHQGFQTVDVERTSQHSWTEGKNMFHVFYQRCRTWTPSARSDVEDSSAVYQQGNPWVWTLLFLFLLSDMFTGTVSNYLDETRSERWSAWVSQESRPGPCSSVPSERTCCVLMTSQMSRRRLQPCFSFVDSTAVKPLITNIWHSAWNQYISLVNFWKITFMLWINISMLQYASKGAVVVINHFSVWNRRKRIQHPHHNPILWTLSSWCVAEPALH